MNINNIEQLHRYIVSGAELEYLFFWSHNQKENSITKTCLSQWYKSSFEVDNIVYQTAEQYMMAEKARLFNDRQCLEKILQTNNAGEVKKLGRGVTRFREEIWIQHRVSIVFRGNLAKFAQNEPLKQFILRTKNHILVEASPFDRIWGISMAIDNPQINDPWQWKGFNLLGFTLMQVREKLRQPS